MRTLKNRLNTIKMRTLKNRVKQVPIIPLIIILACIIMAIFADFIALHSPLETNLSARLRPPIFQEGGSWSYPLGTDAIGRDLLSRIIFGARISLITALGALSLGAVIGISVGLSAAYFGGKVDVVLMRAADVTAAFPMILFAVFLAMTLGQGVNTIIIAVALVIWARFARVIRGEALSIMQRDFIDQARVNGCSAIRIMASYLFPNMLNTIMVLYSLQIGWVILMEATLSFLGAGIPPPTPAWGSMVAIGREYITTGWWVSVVPGIAISLLVLAFNLTGDWLREKLDPKLRQV